LILIVFQEVRDFIKFRLFLNIFWLFTHLFQLFSLKRNLNRLLIFVEHMANIRTFFPLVLLLHDY